MDGQPEILSLASSILGAVVPRFKGARAASAESAARGIAHGATVLVVADPAGTVKHISLNAREVLGEACERAAEFRLSLAELLLQLLARFVSDLQLNCPPASTVCY